MCGICGMAGFADRGLLERMTRSLEHRGPDDEGVYVAPNADAALGNRRLSILDLTSAGRMPMATEDGRLVLSYNGEVYNFRELRQELQSLGHRFRTGTDTEVVLRGYEQWGRGLLSRLNGMFAFGILDFRAEGGPELVLARDRLGIKPLYYTRVGDRLLFASEVRALLQSPDAPRRARPEAMHRYLSFLAAAGPETMFDGIEKLPPGHWLRWTNGRVETGAYHRLVFEPGPGSIADATEAVRATLSAAVRRHLIADVPVGVFLSGGLDSSLVAALAARSTGAPVRAYTIGFRPEDARLEQTSDDARYARIVAKHIGADYHEIVLKPDVAQLLPLAVRHLEEPIADPAAITTYLICTAARPDVKVLLSGHGADELFAGYRVHRNDRLTGLLRHVPGALLRGPAAGLVDTLPKLRDVVPGVKPGLMMAAHRYLGRLLEGADLSREERYIFFRRSMTERMLADLYTPEHRARLGAFDGGDRHREHFAEARADDFLNRVLNVDLRTYLPDHNLLYSDKMSSAASMELRVPFLDNELVDLASRLPVDFKLHRLRGKHVLREAARGVVPDGVIRRRKAGFGAPVRAWLQGDLSEMVDDLLSEERVKRRGYFSAGAVRNMVRQHRAGTADHTYTIWSLLSLELWHQEFIDHV